MVDYCESRKPFNLRGFVHTKMCTALGWAVSEVSRFSVSLESDLFNRFDQFCEAGKFETRSAAVQQLIRERLTTQASITEGAAVAASLTLVYDRHKARLTDRIVDVQHEHAEHVVSSMHVHLSHALRIEVIVLRGPAPSLRSLAAELSGMKGIHQAQLVIICADDEVSDSRNHGRFRPRAFAESV